MRSLRWVLESPKPGWEGGKGRGKMDHGACLPILLQPLSAPCQHCTVEGLCSKPRVLSPWEGWAGPGQRRRAGSCFCSFSCLEPSSLVCWGHLGLNALKGETGTSEGWRDEAPLGCWPPSSNCTGGPDGCNFFHFQTSPINALEHSHAGYFHSLKGRRRI